MQLCTDKRGIQNNMSYTGNRVMLEYFLPLNEVIFDFHDKLKSISKGYGSFDYEIADYRSGNLQKVSILVNGEIVEGLSFITHLEKATARGRVISWEPQASTLRVEPLQNTRDGAANKGYIMFTTLAVNADRGKVYSSESQATISAVSGTQAAVLAVVPNSGPDVGRLSEVTIVGPGSNYRLKPDIIFPFI